MKYILFSFLAVLFFSSCSTSNEKALNKVQSNVKEQPDFNINTMLLRTLKKQKDGTYIGSIYQSQIYKQAKGIDAKAQFFLDMLPETADSTIKGASHDINRLALSENGLYAISGGPSNELIFYDVKNEKVLYKEKFDREIYAVAISKDGKYALSVKKDSESGEVLYWDFFKHKVIRKFMVDKNYVHFLMFAQDEKSFYSIGGRMNIIKHHELKSGKLLKVHKEIYHNRIISKDAKYSIANTHYLYDLHTGKLVHKLELHNESLDTYAFSHDSKTALATTSFGDIIYWDLNSGKIISYISSEATRIHDIVYTKDDKHVIIADWSGKIHYINLESSKTIKTLSFSKKDRFDAYALALSGDDNLLLAGGNDYYSGSYLQRYELNDITSLLVEVTKLKQNLYSKTQTKVDLSSLTYFKDSVYFSKKEKFENLEKLKDIKIKAIDKEITFEKILRPKDSWMAYREIEVSMPLLSNDEKFALVGSENCLLYYDAITGKVIYKFKEKVVGDRIYVYTISKDGTFALFTDENRKIYHVDLVNGKIIDIYKGHKYELQSLEISDNSKFFISSSMDKTIKIWNLETGKVIQTLNGHIGSVRHAYISTDMQKVVSFSWYGEIRSWDIKSAKGKVLNGHMKGRNLVRLDKEEGSVVGYYDENLEFQAYKNEKLQDYLVNNYDDIYYFTLSADRKYGLISNRYMNIQTGETLAVFKNKGRSALSKDGKNAIVLNQDFSINTFNIGLEILRSYE